MVLGDVLEVLAEQRAVEECYDTAVAGEHLCALIGYAVHLASYAVALNVVAHPDASRHERDAVEEVLKTGPSWRNRHRWQDLPR